MSRTLLLTGIPDFSTNRGDMPIAVVGVNFKTAPVEVRERIAFRDDRLWEALAALRAIPHIREAVILSTCHRSELYVSGEDLPRRDRLIIEFLQRFFTLREEECLPHLYRYHEERAARHLFTVASGIDSMILGEEQILGQVKEALQVAEARGAAGRVLNRLFRAAIEVGKRGRSESTLGENSGSVSHAAVLLAKRIFPSLEGKRALVIGTGEIGRLTAKCLVKGGLSSLLVTNRSRDRAEKMAGELGGEVVPFEELTQVLWKADIVISSTSAPHYIVEPEPVARAVAKRRHVPIFLIDLAMPRDIDPRVNALKNVYVYDLDDLEEVVLQENQNRQAAVEKVKRFIEEELAAFSSWYNSLGAVPLIRALQDRMEEIRLKEVTKFIEKFPTLNGKEREAIEALTRGIVNKLAHQPLVQLKEYAAEPDGWKYLETVKDLFGLAPVRVRLLTRSTEEHPHG